MSTTANRTAFFGRIPERAFTLRAERALKSRDLELLGLVMTYAATGRPVVEARQRTLARRLSCSVRTVQRSLARLADQGFLVKQYRRDASGRLLGLSYDVAPTLALMPPARAASGGAARPNGSHADATKTPGGECGPNPASPSGTTPGPTRQNCPPLNETGIVAQRDNTAARSSPPPPPAVVAEMIALGVHARVAATLAARCGEPRCRQVLTALARRAKIRDRAAWCVGCLLENWDLVTAPTPAARPPAPPRIPAQRPFCPPGGAPPAGSDPDPLDALPAGDLLRLEGAARRQLIAEMPVLRASFERGRSLALVRARMKELWAADGSPISGGGD